MDQIVDYQKLFGQLEELLPQLRRNEIKCIVYGTQGMEFRRDYHQISIINTPGGLQFVFHPRTQTGLTGSGEYLGWPTDEQIIKKAQEWIQMAHVPLRNPIVRKYIEDKIKTHGWVPPYYYVGG